MQIKLHPSGPSLSRVVAGAWRWNLLSANDMDRVIQSSLDSGITTFDHADIYGDYGNEELFGAALRRMPALKHNMQTVTKCGIKLLSGKRPTHRIKHYDTSHEHIRKSVDTSLQLLGVDKLDVLLIHRPDPLMNVEVVATAFARLRQEGKVLHFGVSNFSSAQFELLSRALPFPLVTNQIELSLFHHTPLFDGTVDHLYTRQISPMAWSPLGGGKAITDAAPRWADQLRQLTERYQADFSQLLLAWLLQHPAQIFPVIGTGKPERIRQAAEAIDIQLDRQDWFEMLRWVRGADVP